MPTVIQGRDFPERGVSSALLISPPVYDTQYWADWSQPYGLLRIGAWLKARGYKRVELFDFMEVDEQNRVHKHRIEPDGEYWDQGKPRGIVKPIVIRKGGESLELYKYHFGKTWEEFQDWLEAIGYIKRPPNEVYISAIMTYWWESVRDLTKRLKRLWGNRTTIFLGGIYPTLAPEHAARFTEADFVVVGEVPEANDLWTDLSFYERPPRYAIITPARGCPFNCAYCAQKVINNGRKATEFRNPEDVVAEMRDKYERFGIKGFAFYADQLLWRPEENLGKVLELVVQEKLPFRLHAPEGLDTRQLSKSQSFVDLLKKARFQKIYLPLENIDESYLAMMNRKHVKPDHYVKAVEMCEKAGFRTRNMAVNTFVLYGLPGETIDSVVKTILFASEVSGSIIPMLFTPVPGSLIYRRHEDYIKARGWHERLEMLNGKIFPFLEMNEGSIEDYIDLQRLMYTLNAHYRSKSFRIFGKTAVSVCFRENISNGFYERVLKEFDKEKRHEPEAQRRG